MKGEMADVLLCREAGRSFLTDMPGARLFRIAPPNGDAEWRAEMIINGVVQRWRGTNELHARAWLAIWDKPRFTLSVF